MQRGLPWIRPREGGIHETGGSAARSGPGRARCGAVRLRPGAASLPGRGRPGVAGRLAPGSGPGCELRGAAGLLRAAVPRRGLPRHRRAEPPPAEPAAGGGVGGASATRARPTDGAATDVTPLGRRTPHRVQPGMAPRARHESAGPAARRAQGGRRGLAAGAGFGEADRPPASRHPARRHGLRLGRHARAEGQDLRRRALRGGRARRPAGARHLPRQEPSPHDARPPARAGRGGGADAPRRGGPRGEARRRGLDARVAAEGGPRGARRAGGLLARRAPVQAARLLHLERRARAHLPPGSPAADDLRARRRVDGRRRRPASRRPDAAGLRGDARARRGAHERLRHVGSETAPRR